MNLEVQQRIAQLRQKAASNELTLEDCKEAVVFLREARFAAQTASATAKRKSAKAAIPSQDEMLKGMGL